VAAALTERTRVLIINSPHNPGCSCLRAQDLVSLAELVRGRELWVISDEVYEPMVFDGLQHHSVLSLPELRERSVAVYSWGKILHATGLRVGYAVAPPALTAELRKVHQFNTFTISTPLQWAIARYLQERPDISESLGAFFAAKRDRFVGALRGSGWTAPLAEGSFFQLIDYGAFSDRADVELAEELLTTAGVATIPLSVFYQHPPRMTLLRTCIAKRDQTLDAAAARLRAYAVQRQPEALSTGLTS
jgi:methionine aminotransferase